MTFITEFSSGQGYGEWPHPNSRNILFILFIPAGLCVECRHQRGLGNTARIFKNFVPEPDTEGNKAEEMGGNKVERHNS